jgi:hypothetical protein
MAGKNTPKAPSVHHYLRTPVSALFGFIALNLVFASIFVVWANRTLTDTTTFVSAVGPLVTRPAVQDLVVQKVTDQLVESAPTEDLASLLLTPADVAGKTPDQVVPLLKPVIHDSVVQILKSPSFGQLWKATIQADHAQFIQQLDANSPEVTLDLAPFVTGVTEEINKTKLKPISDKIELEPSKAKLDLKGTPIEKIHQGYELLKTKTLLVLAATLVALGLCVWISAHHIKTLRHILISIAVMSLGLALVIQLPQVLSIESKDPVMQKAVFAIATTLLHNLQVACLVLGLACVVLAIGTKFYPRLRRA